MQQQLQQHTYTSSAPQSKSSVFDGVPTAALTGFVDGIIGGVERAVNDLTGGLYGEQVDNLRHNSYTNRQNYLQNQADQSGLGYANRIANSVIDLSSTALRDLYGFTKGGNLLKKFSK